jgi:putative membrane protein
LSLEPIVLYMAYVVSGLVLLAIFFFVYSKLTPYREIELLKQGNRAAAYFFSGAMLGFSTTIASAIMTQRTFPAFLAWAAGALVVQLIVYAGLNRLFSNLSKEIESNNAAVGLLSGATAFCAGIINAACLYS